MTTVRYRSNHNAILGTFFALGLFAVSLGINVFNVYNSFAPATNARFIASGVIDFILMLPGFSLLAIGFRIAAAALLIMALLQRNYGALVNPVWWVYLFILGYGLFTGLANVITTIPFIVALLIVALLQFIEVIFWGVSVRHPMLWFSAGVAYLVEVTLQYAMLPVHSDYDNFFSLVLAMGTAGFNWSGFDLVQGVVALVGLFGIEMGARLLQVIREYA